MIGRDNHLTAIKMNCLGVVVLSLCLFNQVQGADTSVRLDLHGDPLPEGAIARLGTVRMRHGHIINGAVFSGDGKSIIASDNYTGVRVWDVAEGKVVRRFFDKEQHYFHGLAISPDGRTLAVAPGDLTVRLCDPTSGREFAALPKDFDRPNYMVFSPDSSLLAMGTGSETVIWDVATQRLVHKVTLKDSIGHVAFSSDGKLLACNTRNGLCLWDLAQNKEVRQLKNEPDGKHSLFATFAPDGGPLAVWGYDDASIRLFDANGVKEIRRFNKEGAPVTAAAADPWGWIGYIFVKFSPDGRTLAIVRDAGRIDLWDVASGKKRHTLTCDCLNRASILAFSPDGTKLASTGRDNWGGDNTIRVWDVVEGKEIMPRAGHGSPISSVAISPNGNSIATAGHDGIVHLWERSSGKHLLRLEGYRSRRPTVSFSSDGQQVIWRGGYGADGTLRTWDTKTGQLLRRLELPHADASWVAVANDGKTAYSVDHKNRTARTHDLVTGKVTREDKTETYYANSPTVLSPAGDRMISQGGDLMKTAERKVILNVGHVYTPTPNAWFSADGRTLVVAVLQDSLFNGASEPPAEEIAVIDPIVGKELRRIGTLAEYLDPINAAALSRDGKMVVVVRSKWMKPDEQTITLLETETGRERGRYRGHIGPTKSVAISADGRYIVTGACDTTALVWDATKPPRRNASSREAPANQAARFKDLASDNGEQAYAAMWALIDAPKETLSFLDDPSLFAATDVQKIQRWIQDLDSDKFADRDRASQELGLIVDEAEAHLKKALRGRLTAEAQRRIDLLLQKRSIGVVGRELQKLRVIEVLEHIALGADERPAAVAILKKLAAGAPSTRPTQEAKAALARLE